MVDWWQPILYIGAGGVVSLVTAIVTSRLTSRANRESDERQANQRLEEEQRQAIGQIRRERMQPVVEFLDLAKRFFVRGIIREVADTWSPSEDDNIDEEKLEEARKTVKEKTLMGVSGFVELAEAFGVAVASSSSIPGLQEQLREIRGNPDNLDTAIQSAEELIERYLAGAESSATT